MDFRIADTFTGSLARLTGEEQKAVKTTAFDMQIDPTSPGLSFHRLDRAKDKNFWSVRVSGDLRLIVHRTPGSLLLCYADHHDKAYAWAERRRLETHPRTGAAQFVEIRERVQEVVVPTFVEGVSARPTPQLLFAEISEDELLGFGVPAEWMPDVRVATADTVLELADHLPAEAGEALLELATGGRPRPRQLIAAQASPFEHPDAQRRFRIVADVEELQRALDSPWDKWIVFLHPAQREIVERHFEGPARVSGSAGTGKTIVALHRAVFLARSNPEVRVLLTTFSETLANALRARLRRLIGTEPRLAERIEVDALDAVALRLYEGMVGRASIATRDVVQNLVRDAVRGDSDQKFSLAFLTSEWSDVVNEWQLDSWDAYRDVARLGRKTRLPEKQRQTLWSIFEPVRKNLDERGLATTADIYNRLATHLAASRARPYDYVVVDEAQDVGVAQLRFLAAMGSGRPDALFFAGDLGQRIFQLPFSWKSLGVDVRGRSTTLRTNYRTSHQIRMQADRLLGKELSDVDGIVESRAATVSVFNGPAPTIEVCKSEDEEATAVAAWLTARTGEGVAAHELAIFVRSDAQVPRAVAGMKKTSLAYKVLDGKVETTAGHVSVAMMHLAKGLEFRGVAVMACDDEILPLQERISAVSDDADLEEVYNTERHLLYVACTRARDHLLVTSVAPASEFLDDLGS